MAGRPKSVGYLPETLEFIANANASAAATIRREHPDNRRLQRTAAVMDEWAARYRAWAKAERRSGATPAALKKGATL